MYLGAKEITIKEATETKGSFSFSNKKVKIGLDTDTKTTTLRNQKFGKNGVDIEKAKKEIVFTADMPHFRSLFKSREDGNLTHSKFIEAIEVNAGIDISVMNLFNPVSGSFSYTKHWSFEVDFYPKEELQSK